MGWLIKLINRLATVRPITIPIPTAISALMMRLRNSTKWSKNDIAAPESSSACWRGVRSGVAGAAIFYSFRIFLGVGGWRFFRWASRGKLCAGEIGIFPGVFPAQVWIGNVSGEEITAWAGDGCGVGWFGWHGAG